MPQHVLPLFTLLAFAMTKGNADEVVGFAQDGIYKAPVCNITLTCSITHPDLSPSPDWPFRNDNTTNRPWVCVGCEDGFTEEAGFHFEILENNSDSRIATYSLTITRCYRQVIAIACYATLYSMNAAKLVSGIGDSVERFWTVGIYEPPNCNFTLNCNIKHKEFPRGRWPYPHNPSNPPWMCTRCCDGFNEENGFHFDVSEDSDTNITMYSLTVSKCQSETVYILCYGSPSSFESKWLFTGDGYFDLFGQCPKKDPNNTFPSKDYILPTKDTNDQRGNTVTSSYNPAFSLLSIPIILLGLWELWKLGRQIRKQISLSSDALLPKKQTQGISSGVMNCTADYVVTLRGKGIYEPPICNVTVSCFIKHTNLSPNEHWPYPKEVPSKPPWLCLGCPYGITEEAGFRSQIFRRYRNTSLTLHTLTVTSCPRSVLKIGCYAAPNSLKEIQLGSGFFLRLPILLQEGFYIWPKCNVTLTYTVRGYWSDFSWTCSGCPHNRAGNVPGFHATTNSSFLSSTSTLTITSCYRTIVIRCRMVANDNSSEDELSERSIMLSLDKAGCGDDSNCGYLKNGVCSRGRCEYDVPRTWASRMTWLIVGLALGAFVVLFGVVKVILKNRRK